MIERLYGEALYGIDVMSKKLDETNTVLWLYKEKTGEKLSLDDFGSVDFGLPKIQQKIASPGGLAGGYFDGRPTVGNREFKFTTFFKGDNAVSALNGQRIDKILKWFYYDPTDKMWLYWRVKDRAKTYRIEVRPALSGEKYKRLAIADGISLSLIAQKPYFEDTEETVVPHTAVNDDTITINNSGIETPWIIQLTTTSTVSVISCSNENGQSWRIVEDFAEGTVIKVDNGTGMVWVNSVVKNAFFDNGTIFPLHRGVNTLQLIITGSAEWEIRARERII